MNRNQYEIVVVGAGQGGGPLAGAAARGGRRTALIERVHVGGTCVNEGCSPTKTMVASARVAHLVRRAADYGVHATAPRIDLARVHERKQQIVDSFRDGSERSLIQAGVDVIRGRARFVGPRTLDVDVGDGARRTITADTIVINTGLRAAIPSIPGLDTARYLTSTSIMELVDVPAHLVVLGGGYIGLEFAQMFRRFGSRVTVLQRGAQLLDHEDTDVADAVATILRDEGIEVLLGTTVTAVEQRAAETLVRYSTTSVEGATPGTVSGTHLLVASGRRPNTDDLGLDAAGIVVDDRGYIRVDDRLATNVPGVFVIGDAKGGPAFTHISYDDFRILRANLLEGGSWTTGGRQVPYTVFIDPELGRIGMTEKEARTAGLTVRVGTLPMSSVARALETDETRGFMKAIVDAGTQRILGAAVLGIAGGEIATIVQVAMLGGLPYTALRDGIFSHPTVAEALNNLFTAMDRAV